MSGVAALRLNLTRSLYYLSTALISVIFSLVVLELMSAVYFVFFSPHFYRPVYLRNEALADWQTEFEPWGAWHKPNASLVH